MTRVFDDNARQSLASCVPLFGSSVPNEAKPHELDIQQVAAKTLRPYIASGHYSGTFPDSTRESFAGYYGLTLSCGVLFGMGANVAAFTAVIPEIQDGEYRELTRLWVDDDAPRNTASRLVAGAIRSLPPEVRLVVSFADTAQGHAGYIYQALNFHYLGMTQPGTSLRDEDGDPVHPRLLGIYRMRRPELAGLSGPEIAHRLGWTFVAGSAKHRYVLAVGPKKARRRMDKRLIELEQPYPKGLTQEGGGAA